LHTAFGIHPWHTALGIHPWHTAFGMHPWHTALDIQPLTYNLYMKAMKHERGEESRDGITYGVCVRGFPGGEGEALVLQQVQASNECMTRTEAAAADTVPRR
jgi:hypothetical protein